MNSTFKPRRMEDMPAGVCAAPLGPADARARYFNSGNAFNVVLPPVPAATFMPDARVVQAARASFVQACDQSAALGSPVAATTPLMLAAYQVIAPGESADTRDVTSRSSGSLWYVMAGGGACASASHEAFAFHAGDVFMLPGGDPWRLAAGDAGAVFWRVDNSPQLAHEQVMPSASSTLQAVHYPADEIERQLAELFDTTADATTSGFALVFSSDLLGGSRNVLPTLTLSLNTLPAGDTQRAHRHNSAAITLVLDGEKCCTRIDGEPVAWSRGMTLVTPPGALHSHHNEGASQRARFLIVQDGALHYHCRTMGFAFENEASARV
ncbi:Gentisate 1,2-dioxygenase [Caballeronia hypogeia]|uniref:Gentisate 1,2-dioxygenase n=1 Tax=Caballeronia hypogeia TaxID=1777140 RepID=A0A158DH55_9BURK|nr:cupin domain-containing protein [Caballeronia hypogeia]SAK93914.1 Gentisate 1,2-dioxygenase [Caballeronia hypogeia]